jgi:hypothetical protein
MIWFLILVLCASNIPLWIECAKGGLTISARVGFAFAAMFSSLLAWTLLMVEEWEG